MNRDSNKVLEGLSDPKNEVDSSCQEPSRVWNVEGINSEDEKETVRQSSAKAPTSYAFLGMKQAMASPTAHLWREAIAKEKSKLESTKTWRDLTKEEISANKKVIPIALLLTEKRDGTHKCRAVVLGNQCEKVDGIEHFAPVVSWVALRGMLTTAAREMDYIRVFDLDNAFLNAEVGPNDPPVYVSLPTAWRYDEEKPVKRLLRALYGLPQSPKLWYKTYAKGLMDLGWEVSPFEPGVWRKHSKSNNSWLKLVVYVDDNVITGPGPK